VLQVADGQGTKVCLGFPTRTWQLIDRWQCLRRGARTFPQKTYGKKLDERQAHRRRLHLTGPSEMEELVGHSE